ncbi:MAG TPA: peptidoglycan DD-metalloendopeptidase family protein [Vicinamibacterales bacterium]|nr:peptidoglycan DD-metalloendopeptidase family protein [Vicinamibacterales bacterium]
MACRAGLMAAAATLYLIAGTRLDGRAGVDLTVRARATEPGELLIVTVKTEAPAAIVRVRAFDRDAPAFKEDALTWRALVGIDLDLKPGTYSISAEAQGASPESQRATKELVVSPHEFPTRQLTVDEQYVNPPEATMERIAQEQKDLNAIWAAPAPTRLWSGSFERPVKEEANSAFGSRSVFNGEPRSPHSGADFKSPAGTPVHAPNAGKVVLARDLYFTGNTVIIDHGLGLFSLFAHFSAINVHEGDSVKTGQLLGAVGATGRVTGPHLHWAIRLNGARIDPLSVLELLK